MWRQLLLCKKGIGLSHPSAGRENDEDGQERGHSQELQVSAGGGGDGPRGAQVSWYRCVGIRGHCRAVSRTEASEVAG